MAPFSFGQVGSLFQKLGPAIRNFAGEATENFVRQQAVAGLRRVGPAVRSQALQGGLPGTIADLRTVAAAPIVRRNLQGAGALAGIAGANQTELTDQIQNSLGQVGPAVDKFFGNITPQAIQQFGKEQEKRGLGSVLEMATPFGFLAAPFIPNSVDVSQATSTKSLTKAGQHAIGAQSVLNGKPVYWAGKDYGWQQLSGKGASDTLTSLNAPGVQDRFIQDKVSGGASPPPAPNLPPPNLGAGSGSQAGQQTSPPLSPVLSDVPPGGSFAGGPIYGGVGVSNGAGVPALRQNVQNRALSQEVLNAAQQYSAPTSVPLSSFYAGQQQLGRSMMQGGQLEQQLQALGGATGMTPDALKQWAAANPGPAYSLLEKLKRRSQ